MMTDVMQRWIVLVTRRVRVAGGVVIGKLSARGLYFFRCFHDVLLAHSALGDLLLQWYVCFDVGTAKNRILRRPDLNLDQ